MLCAVAAFLLAAPQAAQPKIWIAFVSDRHGNEEIYAIPVRPSDQAPEQRRLTNHPARDIQPTVGPEGEKVAWASNRSGNWDIWVCDLSGGGLENLTDTPDFDETNPAWSNGGFIFCMIGGRPHRIDPDSGELKEISATPLHHDGRVSVSPNGDAVVYRDPRKAGLQLFEMDGTRTTIIPQPADGEIAPLGFFNPSYSCEGRRIIFDTGGPSPSIYIYDMDLEECRKMRVTHHGTHPVFGSFGEGVIFVAPGVAGGMDLFWAGSDAIRSGTPVKPSNITFSKGNDMDPGNWALRQP